MEKLSFVLILYNNINLRMSSDPKPNKCRLVLKCFKDKRSKRSSCVFNASVDERTVKQIGDSLFWCLSEKSMTPVFRPTCYYTYISNGYQKCRIVEEMMKYNSENKIPKSYFNPKTFAENMYFLELYSSEKLEIKKRGIYDGYKGGTVIPSP